MYQVKIYDGPHDKTGFEIHSPKVNQLKVEGESLKLSVTGIDGFRFTLYPNNPGYGKIKPLTTLVTVYDTLSQQLIFEGRVLGPTDRMRQDGVVSASYQCGSLMSYLQDSIQSWAKIQNTTPRQMLQHLINSHNSQVESHKRFILGEVTVTNSTDNVYRYIDDTATTYESIMDKLVDRIGGELRVRKINGQLVLDWVNEVGGVSETVIRVQKNMISVTKENDPTEVITRLFPRGARLDVEDNEEFSADASVPRLTIAEVNSGREYLDADPHLIEAFGLVSGVVTWDDTTQAQNLLRNGREWLSDQSTGVLRVEMRAVDLNLLGLDPDRFRVGDYYKIQNPLVSLDDLLRIIEMDIDINHPEQSTLILGDKPLTLSQYQKHLKQDQQRIHHVEGLSLVQGRRLTTVSRSVNEAQQSIVELRQVLNEVDLNHFDAFRREVLNHFDALFSNVGEIGHELVTLQNQFNQYVTEQSNLMSQINNRLMVLERGELNGQH